MGSRPVEILRLYRLHTAAATAAVVTLAVLAAGADLITSVLIFIGAVLNHAWGFSLNEIGDLDVDRMSPDLSDKPLVSGSISVKAAWIYSSSALIFSFLFILLASLRSGTSPLLPIVFIFAGTVSGFIYDLWGKRFPSDIFVSAWIFFLVLGCSSAVVSFIDLPVAVWAVAVIAPLHILFNNSVEGGIKDLDHDREAGARTMAIALGCGWKNGRRYLSRSFMAWGILLRAVYVVISVIFAYVISIQEGFGFWVVLSVGTLGMIIFAHSLTFIRSDLSEDRKDLIRRFSIQEILSFTASVFVVIAAVGVVPGISVFLISVIWFVVFNRILFRTGISPKV